MKLGFAIRAMVAAGTNRLKLFGKARLAGHKSRPAVATGEPAFSKSDPTAGKSGAADAAGEPAFEKS
jgi:hypothetical protein